MWYLIVVKSCNTLLLTQEAARAQSEEPGPSLIALEGPVLMAINVERTQQGLDSAHKLTVQLLKAHLKGKFINGQEWKAGNKKKEDFICDYRCVPMHFVTLHAALHLTPHKCGAPTERAVSWSMRAVD